MNKKLLAIFLIACLTSSCFLTSCSKDSEAEPLEEAVEETMEEAVEEAVEETPEIQEEAEITITPEQQLTEGDTSGADSKGVDGEFEEGEYRGDEEEDIEYDSDQSLMEILGESYEAGGITEEELKGIIEELGLDENNSTPATGTGGGTTNQQYQYHNTPEGDAYLAEHGSAEEQKEQTVFGQGDYSSTRGGRVY